MPKEPTTKPDMVVCAAEGQNVPAVGQIIADCIDTGGSVVSIIFTGNRPSPAKITGPNTVSIEGMYTVFWLELKKEEPGDNGKSLKIAEPGDEADAGTG